MSSPRAFEVLLLRRALTRKCVVVGELDRRRCGWNLQFLEHSRIFLYTLVDTSFTAS